MYAKYLFSVYTVSYFYDTVCTINKLHTVLYFYYLVTVKDTQDTESLCPYLSCPPFSADDSIQLEYKLDTYNPSHLQGTHMLSQAHKGIGYTLLQYRYLPTVE